MKQAREGGFRLKEHTYSPGIDACAKSGHVEGLRYMLRDCGYMYNSSRSEKDWWSLAMESGETKGFFAGLKSQIQNRAKRGDIEGR